MGEMRDSREFGTNELPSKEQELSRLRAENERLTAEIERAEDEARIWRETTEGNSEIISREHARALAAEARAEKAAEDMRERAAKVADDIGRDYGDDETGWLDCSETIATAIRSLASLPKESADV